jgi:ribonuclease P protein component
MGKLQLLKTEQDFQAFRASKSFQTKLLKIRVHYSLNQNIPRFGFIIPKKQVPKVVDRNLLKRRIKSVLNLTANKLQPADIVFYPQKALVKQPFPMLSEEINQLFTQARLWKS